jgi:hypothetical protein
MLCYATEKYSHVDIYILFSIISLTPKENDAREIRKFRPITLTNCSFKIFTKALTNKFARIVNRLILSKGDLFWKCSHEIIHVVYKSKTQHWYSKLTKRRLLIELIYNSCTRF